MIWPVRSLLLLSFAALFAGLGVPDALGARADGPNASSGAGRSVGASSVVMARKHRSGLPWLSGVFAHSSGQARSFSRMRGTPVDFVSVHPSRESWQSIRDPWWLRQTAGVRAAGASLEVSVPLWPGDSSVYRPARKQWRGFGRLLVRKGEGDAIVTIGKEFNLDNPWHIDGGNQSAWRARFRQAVQALRSVPGEHFTIAWTPNEGPSQTGVSPLAAWPGDKYVDVVAPDYYDQWSPVRSREQAHARFTRKFGLEWWFRWAGRHGARVGVSEWGVSSGTQWAGHSGGDNAFYVKAMHRLFWKYRGRLAYESYFAEPAPYLASDLVTQNPRAARAYRRLWGR